MDICATQAPEPFMTVDGTAVACHLHTAGPRLNGEPLTSVPVPAAGAAAAGVPAPDAGATA
jgi:hypothetical protein